MSSSALADGIRHLRGQLAAHERHAESDEQLLHAFLSRRDDSAFAVLVRRHGPMVLHVCRRVLGHEQDAEDAFQAVFLVLARNAASLRNKTLLASFLHGTAYRTAMKAKQSAARRRKHEGRTPARPQADPAEELSWREVRALLDEEIARLPAKYHIVFVFFYLENLSRAETARRLGLTDAAVAKRLAEARKRLAQRLTRRGVELTAVLAATSLATPSASALPAGLMASTLKVVLATTAGEGLAGVVSASVAELVKDAATTMMVSKAKIATIVFLSLSLLGGAGVWLNAQPKATVPLPAQPSAATADDKPKAAPSKPEEAKTVEFRGQVLDPDGKPFAGAKLHLIYPTEKELPIPARATSDAEGRFRFRVAKTDFDTSKLEPWEDAIVVAAAEGYGLGMAVLRADKSVSNTALMLRLAKDDAPLKGRMLDLQGKPVAGAAVRVHGLHVPVKGDLAAFVSDLKDKKEFFPPLQKHLFGSANSLVGRGVSKLFAPVKTGDDGRFEIKGVGRERLAALRIEGPTLATRDVYAMTRAGDTIHAPGYRQYEPRTDKFTLYGKGFDHIAAPCRPIVGVVRDKDTGKPIPGAVVTSYKRAGSYISAVTDLHTVADKNGRYRLLGMPKGEGNVIQAGPPEDEPYLMATQNIADTPGLDPVTADVALKRGVWISGRVLDKVTRQPIHAQIGYGVFADNPHRKEIPGLSVDLYLQSRVEDGTFRVVALPGRGLLAARAWSDQYRTGIGADKIKGLEPNGFFRTYPHLVSAHSYQTLVEVNPAVDAKQVTCSLLLDPGHTLKGEVRDPDGKPLTGVRVSGLRSYNGHSLWEHEPLKTSTFIVTGLDPEPEQSRLLEFVHVEKNLAGSVVVKSNDKGPLVVKLVPAGALTGRLVILDGKPITDGEVIALYQFIGQPERRKVDSTAGTLPSRIRPDKDGKFRIEGLVPGLTYYLGFSKGNYLHRLGGAAGGKLTFEQGQTRNLGDVVVKPIE
jgi:RNA polymerase sigma factor (sigma-70 family)